ncbi:MAG TPA: hypothetical protein VG676_01090 [Chitinophagaceae bacterium]|nr:hypothetical protein [Chitinophagaceae bacterium]
MVIFISSSTELHQLLRLPVLFSHYQEHKQDDEKTGFADFIVFHYFNGDITDGDSTHDDLPFTENHAEALHITVAVLPADLAGESFILFNPESAKGIYQPQLFPSSVLPAIWQPPKV